MDSNENKKKNMKEQNTEEEIRKDENQEIASADESEKEEELKLKDTRIKELERETSELKDKYLRKVAEFENYKRRNEIDQLNLIKYSAISFIFRLLPVIDDFERSIEHIEEARNVQAIKEGLKLVYDKFLKALDDEGVKKIAAAGKPFDVNFHEAIMQKKDDSVEPHTVLDEIEKGYIYKDKVIRHSKVIVSEDVTEESLNENKNNLNNEGSGK